MSRKQLTTTAGARSDEDIRDWGITSNIILHQVVGRRQPQAAGPTRDIN